MARDHNFDNELVDITDSVSAATAAPFAFPQLLWRDLDCRLSSILLLCSLLAPMQVLICPPGSCLKSGENCAGFEFSGSANGALGEELQCGAVDEMADAGTEFRLKFMVKDLTRPDDVNFTIVERIITIEKPCGPGTDGPNGPYFCVDTRTCSEVCTGLVPDLSTIVPQHHMYRTSAPLFLSTIVPDLSTICTGPQHHCSSAPLYQTSAPLFLSTIVPDLSTICTRPQHHMYRTSAPLFLRFATSWPSRPRWSTAGCDWT